MSDVELEISRTKWQANLLICGAIMLVGISIVHAGCQATLAVKYDRQLDRIADALDRAYPKPATAEK